MCGELEGGEVYLVRAKFAGESSRRGVLSVKTHRRAATGNTKSREVAGALAGTAPSSTARNSSTRRGL